MTEEQSSLLQAVHDFQQGKEKAFTEIYNRTNKYVYYTIYKSVKDAAIAEDVMQETYLEVYRSLSSLKSGEAVKSWIAKIAHHRIYQYLKKNPDQLLKEEEQEAVFEQLEQTDEALMPEDVMDNRETQRLIGEIINSLSEEQRLSIVAFYFNQMSIKEIAEAYGIPENTVKSHLSRGKKKIKDGVLELEKKHGTKLYATGIAAILFFVLDKEASACEISSGLTVKVLESAAAQASGTAAADGAAAGSAGAAASGAAAGGAGLSLGAKIAIAVAGVVLAGGVAAAGMTMAEKAEQSRQEAAMETAADEAPKSGTENRLIGKTVEESGGSPANGAQTADESVPENMAGAEENAWMLKSDVLTELAGEGYGTPRGNVMPVKRNGLWGAVNYEGEEIVPCIYSSFAAAPNEYGQFVLGDGEWECAFDKEGNLLGQATDIVSVCGEFIVKKQADWVDEWGYVHYVGTVEKLDGTVLLKLEQGDGDDFGIVGFGDGSTAWAGNGNTGVSVDKNGNIEEEQADFWMFLPKAAPCGGYYVAGWGDVADYTLNGADSYSFTPEFIALQALETDDTFWLSHTWAFCSFLQNGCWSYNNGTRVGYKIIEGSTGAEEKAILIDAAKVPETLEEMDRCVLGVFDSLLMSDERYWLIGQDGRRGYIDHDGNVLCMYDDAAEFENGYAVIKENGGLYLIDESFEKLAALPEGDRGAIRGDMLIIEKNDASDFYRFLPEKLQ
ncbi:MAG: sigma-70 family RNA polymerase sigma factor [Eubacteriales bacterium]|nr:sigma-70 family RNA polymerase sigma factor [Eubacteriales bacterium]